MIRCAVSTCGLTGKLTQAREEEAQARREAEGRLEQTEDRLGQTEDQLRQTQDHLREEQAARQALEDELRELRRRGR